MLKNVSALYLIKGYLRRILFCIAGIGIIYLMLSWRVKNIQVYSETNCECLCFIINNNRASSTDVHSEIDNCSAEVKQFKSIWYNTVPVATFGCKGPFHLHSRRQLGILTSNAMARFKKKNNLGLGR